MKKGQIVEGTVQRVDFPNKGIVETEEGVCVVKNVLPGQKIRCSIQKARNGRAEGRLLEVVETSPLQTDEPCPHFGICGGCTYLSIPYAEQLKIKEMQVKKLLDSVLRNQMLCKQDGAGQNLQSPEREPYRFEGIKPSPICYGYRNKMEFSFGDEIKDGPLALGMHKRGSFYDVVSVTGCKIVDEDYRRILKCALDYFGGMREQGAPVSFYHRLRRTGYLRHLLVRKGAATGEILVALVTTSQYPGKRIPEDELLYGFKEKLLALSLDGKIVGILHTVNDAVADVVQSDTTKVLYGQDFFYEELLGLKFRVSQFSFFQTNSRGAEVLYETAREYIGKYIAAQNGAQECHEQPDTEAADMTDGRADKSANGKSGKVVYDLYSGTGTIAQLMAPVADQVIGVEIVEEAVEAARKNAELNGLHNCKFIAGDVLKVLDEIPEKPDIIILDPPRDGVHPKALKKILEYGVEHILYISCKPTSLVRDLDSFLEKGYTVERAVAVDQFPWTANVETVVMLSHKKPDSVINVKVEFGEGEGKVPLDNIAKRAAAYKPKERVTYKMIKEYIEAKYGFKVHTAYIAEVKRNLGLPMYDAPNAVEELKQPRKHPTPEKVEAIKDALKHFEVI